MPTQGSARTKTLTIRVGPNLKGQIDAYAKAREMTAGEFVRYCVLVYMDSTFTDPDEWDGAEPPSEEEMAAQPPLEIGEIRRGA